jgi:hypothetical protein
LAAKRPSDAEKEWLLADSLGGYFVIVPPQGSMSSAVYAYSIQSLPALPA